MGRQENVWQCPMSRFGELQTEPPCDRVQVVSEIIGEDRPTQPERAEAWRQFDVPPAEVAFVLQKSHIEARIMGDERRPRCESKKLREHFFDARCRADIFWSDFVHLPRFPRNIAFGVDERHEGFCFIDTALVDAYASDFDDTVSFVRIQTCCFDIEDGQGGQGR